MTKAGKFISECETLAGLGNQIDHIVSTLQRSGFLVVSVDKGDAGRNPEIKLDTGATISICKNTGVIDVTMDGAYASRLHPKQRFFNPTDLVTGLQLINKEISLENIR